MTPLDGSVTTASKMPAKPPSGLAMYPSKMRTTTDAINELIGGVLDDVVQCDYWRLNYANPAYEAIIDKTERGLCTFHYNPNAFGSGKKGWRLFYEDRHYVSNEGDVVGASFSESRGCSVCTDRDSVTRSSSLRHSENMNNIG
ncbi:hypothetical protein M409DRAFT_59198 [Zasmidium cellare ATCC 36951]|uniref:Uncharacterized protein n=1 Tax=Zasmidium cellare ATCC 36951 TaxID=1080233 RepID=A0A6A6C3K6_ZASCE|nr:uncharacterized protein M409DRAFT_59198 [Zasmidium cellare ATCC 36951]KAF2161503.1 hypothetical protein M409DRAFT_59198 [Zasmidium cellare ATCC 36951]